ncbi:MAG: hypothetical protein R2748_21980 [Bryobacterales bacterium]
MSGRVGVIDADCHPGYTASDNPGDGGLRQELGCTRRDGRSESQCGAELQQIEDVGTLQRVSAGENHQRVAEAPYFLEQEHAFERAQLSRVAARLRAHARQCAQAKDKPASPP